MIDFCYLSAAMNTATSVYYISLHMLCEDIAVCKCSYDTETRQGKMCDVVQRCMKTKQLCFVHVHTGTVGGSPKQAKLNKTANYELPVTKITSSI